MEGSATSKVRLIRVVLTAVNNKTSLRTKPCIPLGFQLVGPSPAVLAPWTSTTIQQAGTPNAHSSLVSMFADHPNICGHGGCLHRFFVGLVQAAIVPSYVPIPLRTVLAMFSCRTWIHQVPHGTDNRRRNDCTLLHMVSDGLSRGRYRIIEGSIAWSTVEEGPIVCQTPKPERLYKSGRRPLRQMVHKQNGSELKSESEQDHNLKLEYREACNTIPRLTFHHENLLQHKATACLAESLQIVRYALDRVEDKARRGTIFFPRLSANLSRGRRAYRLRNTEGSNVLGAGPKAFSSSHKRRAIRTAPSLRPQ